MKISGRGEGLGEGLAGTAGSLLPDPAGGERPLHHKIG